MHLDLIGPSFPPLPEAMWVAASEMIDVVIQKCWLLLAAFLALKVLTDTFSQYDQLSFSTHVRTLFKAIGIVLLLSYYKKCLMCFDNFIDSLCIHLDDTPLTTEPLKGWGGSAAPTDAVTRSGILKLLSSLFEKLFGLVSLLSHSGAIAFMNYMRAVALLILMQIGPLCSILSLLPGPFQNSFKTWLKSYVYISCWAITLSLFTVFIKAFRAVHLASGESSTIAYACLSIVLLMAIFLTPTWTARFIGSVSLGSYIAGIGALAGKVGRVTLSKVSTLVDSKKI